MTDQMRQGRGSHRRFAGRAARGWAWITAAVLALMIGTAVNGYGAQSSVIEKMTITFKTTFGDQGVIPDPEITFDGEGCSMGDIQFRTDYDKWKPGKKVRVEITINADEGKVFPVSLTRSQCKVSGADFVSAKGLDDGTLQVKVDYKPVTVLGDTTRAGWNSTKKTQAVWHSVEYAPGYTLILYGDNKVIKRLNVDTNSVDLAEYMDDEDKTYYYEVKAVPRTSEEKKYLKEGNFVGSSGQEIDWEDTPDGAGDGGSMKGNSYILPDGTKETNTWKKISGQWYYFDQNGTLAAGWQAIDGFWYYFGQKGQAQTGWIRPDGVTWYYMGDNGAMHTGWVQPQPGIWYYLDPSGKMQTGWAWISGKWYYMDLDGRMHTGWLLDGEHWYYLYSDGSMATDAVIDGWNIGADGIAVR